MNITKEQIESAQKGKAVRIPTDSGELVILSAEMYDRVAILLSDDPRETYSAALKAWDAEGSPDDATAYQDLA